MILFDKFGKNRGKELIVKINKNFTHGNAENYLKKIMKKYRNKNLYDPNTGIIKHLNIKNKS